MSYNFVGGGLPTAECQIEVVWARWMFGLLCVATEIGHFHDSILLLLLDIKIEVLLIFQNYC